MSPLPYNYRYCKISSLTSRHVNLVAEAVGSFKVSDLDGWMKPLSRLSTRPYIIETGSLSCPFFKQNRPAMDRLAQCHPEIDFFVLYTREAHPTRDTRAHTSMTDKLDLAHDMQLMISPRRRIIVEDLRGLAHKWLGGLPNSLTLVEDQKVVLHLTWNNPGELEQYLTEFQNGKGEIRLRHLPSVKRIFMALSNTNFSARFHYGAAMLKLYLREWFGRAPRYLHLIKRKLSSQQSRAS